MVNAVKNLSFHKIFDLVLSFKETEGGIES